MTPAETLREAASQIRDDTLVATRAVRPFLNAVADWLDDCAEQVEDPRVPASPDFSYCDEPGAIHSALGIARAYLEEKAP